MHSTSEQRIYARNCAVIQLEHKVADEFLIENHLQGACQSRYQYGLLYNDTLVSVMTFSKSRFKNEFELTRFCNRLYTDVVGGASRLLKHFLKDHSEIKEIVSFADRRWSIGKLYEKLHFVKIDTTKPSYFYCIDGMLLNRMNFQKHKLVAEGYDSSKTEHQIMLDRKMYRIYDCGSLKFKYTMSN